MDQRDTLPAIADSTDELLRELSRAEPAWVRGRIEQIRDMALTAIEAQPTEPDQPKKTDGNARTG